MGTLLKTAAALVAGLGLSITYGIAHAGTLEGDYLVKLAPQKSKVSTQAFRSLLPTNTKVESLGQNVEGENWVHITVPPTQVKAFGIDAVSQLPGVLYAQPNYRIFMREAPSITYFRNGIKQMLAYHATYGKWPTDDKCPFPIPQLCPPNGGGGGGGGGDQKCPFPIPQLCPPNGGGGGGGGGGKDCPLPIPGLCDPNGGGGGGGGSTPPANDNPPIPAQTTPGTGADPLIAKQWGMIDIGAEKVWTQQPGAPVVVAVIDTGIDYTHEDLVDSLWRNPGEMGTDASGKDKSNNGIDDDKNGFVDDVIGWDFVSNDNKPYDLSVPPEQLLQGEGNPGHGTHCSGNVGARGENGKGISGVDPNARIMGLRFLSDKGEGTTAGAVKAINYALQNGAQVMSNSWGSEGEDPSEATDNKALHDAIHAAEAKGVLFIAAAGNGRSAAAGMTPAVGYDNDTDSKPGMPATYPDDIIISVAAVDSQGNLGSFSNYGVKTVHIGAPGVKVFSTTVGSKYNDMVIDMGGIQASWDGTSMATPHVAGAAALYLSKHPNASWQTVKSAILKGAQPTSSLTGKVQSGGRLNVEGMLNN